MSKTTNYNGTGFRSELQATWAAFFDLAGWRWEYFPKRKRVLLENTGESDPTDPDPLVDLETIASAGLAVHCDDDSFCKLWWRPDFLLRCPCDHSDCEDRPNPHHEFWVRVYESADILKRYECYLAECWDTRAVPALFGEDPDHTVSGNYHGNGVENDLMAYNADELWEQAQRKVRGIEPAPGSAQ